MSEICNCHIDPGFAECISDVQNRRLVKDKFYINVEPSVYEVQDFDVNVRLVGDQVEYDAGEGNLFKKTSTSTYKAVLQGCEYGFSTMKEDLSHVQPNSHFTCIDVLPTKFALGDTEGHISIYDSKIKKRLELVGHCADITSVKFFPSEKVLLSSSIDMQVKIWSLEDGSNPRTLTGHRAAVTCTEIIDRGRNILTSSQDGTIRLWECGSGKVVHKFSRKENTRDPINDMALLDTDVEQLGSNDLEFGTAGKRVLAGHGSGVVTYHDIFSKEQLLQLPSEHMCACTTLSTSTPYFSESSAFYVYTGYENGALAQWDLRMPKKSIEFIYINKGTPINSIYSVRNKLFLSSNVDTAMEFSLDSQNGNIKDVTYLVSNDYRVAQFKSSSDFEGVYAVGKEGFWGRY